MAITTDNLFVAGFSGMVGRDIVFRKRKSGKIVVAKSPKKSAVPPSPKQLEMRRKFSMGIKYAKMVRGNAGLYAAYALAVKDDQTPTNIAIRDLCTPPQIKSIDISDYSGAPGSVITVHAVDDFKVNTVRLKIYSGNNILIEEGEALQSGVTDYWIFSAKGVNRDLSGSVIKAIAVDLPGNETEYDINCR